MQRVSGCRAPVLRARGYIVNAFTSATRHLSRRESAMRFTLFTTLAAFAIVACGGDKKSAASQAEAATPTPADVPAASEDRKSTRLNSSHTVISYAVFCLKKKKKIKQDMVKK